MDVEDLSPLVQLFPEQRRNWPGPKGIWQIPQKTIDSWTSLSGRVRAPEIFLWTLVFPPDQISQAIITSGFTRLRFSTANVSTMARTQLDSVCPPPAEQCSWIAMEERTPLTAASQGSEANLGGKPSHRHHISPS